ncbi:hypothetical protein TWF481_012027 [Arthrobotrys musiformis]|uniref:Uncharacterized protein n=1 Tax=Arthrobotrys musiformis TaxID=47236 RepID=A0AAV9VVZ7_9PEZI
MEETKQGVGPWANLPASKDPASPHYLYHPEHERLSSIIPSTITSPSITPALPSFIAYWTGMYSMYGVHGRDSVYIVAMRRRAELIPRPFTQTEHAVLARYSQNMQNGAEYFGLLGLVGGGYWATRTEFWPMEKSFRTMFGLQGGATGSEPLPPSGLVYPNGWGQQKEGGGNAGAPGTGSTTAAGPTAGTSSTVNQTVGSTSTAAPTAGNTTAPTNIPSHSKAFGKPDPTIPRIDITKITADYLRGPRVNPVAPTFNYAWALNINRWMYMLQMPPQYLVGFTMWQIRRLQAIPLEQRGNEYYKQRYELAEYSIRWARLLGQKVDRNRQGLRAELDEDMVKIRKGVIQQNLDEAEALYKEVEEFDRRMAESRRAWLERTSAATAEIEAGIISSKNAAASAAASQKAVPQNWNQLKESFKNLAQEAKAEAEAEAQIERSKAEAARSAAFKPHGAPRVELPPGAIVFQFNPIKSIKNAIRVGTWAFFGKYVVGTIGLIWLTSGSRKKEIVDERLQEYNYDRMEYAKLRMKEAASRRGLPVPPSQQQQQEQEPHPGDEGGAGSRQPQRFEPVDGQSLGGVQSESIDWGDFVKDDTPALSRQSGNDSALPPIRPGESAWDRARRAREGPQGPAMEEDRWAPQVQQDTAVKTDDMANMSRWERIRQQASEGYGGERRLPGEARDGGDNTSSFGGFGRRQQGQDRQKTKEELQREFDAQVDKERRGEEGPWK